MEIIGITRERDGKQVEEFVVGHPEHSYWYKGQPPLTHGCRECWTAYYFAEFARNGSQPNDVEALEAAIRHAAEAIDAGNWDFKPEYDFTIEHEN